MGSTKATPEERRNTAWREWDDAVVLAYARGWALQALMGDLLNAHYERAAARVAECDCLIYAPTRQLGRADRVTSAVKAAEAWDKTIVRSGLLDVLLELEHEGRVKERLADIVAGQRAEWERVRDVIAGSATELVAATVVAVGGGHRAQETTGQLGQLF